MSDLYSKKIASLIAKEICDEISEQELKELRKWIRKDEGNNLLYSRLRSSKSFKSWLVERNTIDVEQDWSNLIPKIKKKSRAISLKRIMRVAAAIILPVMIGSAAYLYVNKQIENRNINRQKYAEIKTGSSKAVLTMGDGTTVELDSIKSLSLTEVDGTQIKKTEGKINYTNSAKVKVQKQVYNTINIPRGGEYKLVLADGTTVYLNSMTTLKYPVRFAGNIREVELIGEAFFEVTKDTAKPFVVNTKEMGIEVLGTSFNVYAYDDSEVTVATLVEGKVKLTHPADWFEDKVLEPNEQVVMQNENGRIDLRTVDVSHYTSWKDGKLVFYNESLEDIMITLTRWYSAKIFYMDPGVKEIRFSGSLDKYDDITKFLDVIEAAQLVNVEIKNNTILFSEK